MTTTAAPGPSQADPLTPLPASFGIVLDDDTRDLGSDRILGGQPARLLRLKPGAGTRAFEEIKAGTMRSRAARLLGRRLVDHGMAHPQPPIPETTPDVAVIVPAHNRVDLLDAALAALVRTGAPVTVVDDGSDDPDAIAACAHRHGAAIVRHDMAQGPAGARNTGLRHVSGDLVALVDSDCVVTPGWLAALAAHFDDPLVGAVAPRVVAAPPAASGPERYCEAHGPIDMADRPGRVMPGTRVPFVPTAALMVRMSAVTEPAEPGGAPEPHAAEPFAATGPFDRSLRYCEDVDLIWRMHAAGWRVRYVPSVQVLHQEPTSWSELWRRRFRYGTSAAPLAQRHPDAYIPLVLSPWPAAVIAGLAVGQPVLAAVAFGGQLRSVARATRRVTVETDRVLSSAWLALHTTFRGVGTFMTQLATPVLVAGITIGKGGNPTVRRATLGALIAVPIVLAYRETRPRLHPVRYAAVRLIDEMSYGAGVIAGCIRERTIRPLTPTVVGHAAVAAAA